MDNPATSRMLEASISRLEEYLVAQGYRGYDPYDALQSPLFRLPGLRSSRWIRIAAEQALKRVPINLRPLLRVPKGYNPVTLAFVLQASVYRALADPTNASAHKARAAHCVSELERLQTRGYSGTCWGYDFDWESRYGRLPAGTPTVVATGLVANALFVAYRFLGLEQAFQLCQSASSFVVEDLPRTAGDDESFCWGYFPGDTQRVINASLKGARLCGQVYSVSREEQLLHAARGAVAYAVRHQRDDGSWPYAVGDRRSWTDNFHSAYVLDALDDYERFTLDRQFHSAVEAGWRFYRANFFVENRLPKYYAHALYPIDATACAQSLLTLCRFGDTATAESVAKWAIGDLQLDGGSFAYQRRRRRVVKVPYMRWSSAYMYLGLSRVSVALNGQRGVE